MPERQKILRRAPRADKLNLARDILHLLVKHGGALTLKSLFVETEKEFTPPKTEIWKWETFYEYVVFLKRLKLARVAPPIVRILEAGRSIVSCSNFAEKDLGECEKQFFKSLLFSYAPFLDFLVTGFCRGKSFQNEEELREISECPRRVDLLRTYMKAHQQKDDREARAMLYWGTQIGLIEFDECHKSFLIVNPRRIDSDSFLTHLFQAYNESRDFKTRMALIPEVRFRCCCALKISRKIFDEYLIRFSNEHPTTIELGRASSSRTEVVKYGVIDNRNYYYYIKIVRR